MRFPVLCLFAVILTLGSVSRTLAQCDDLETDLWSFSHVHSNYDGTWNAQYTTDEARSPTRSIGMSMVGGGSIGRDFDHVQATRIYPVSGAPGDLDVWFNFAGFSGSSSVDAYCAVDVDALDASDQSLATQRYCVAARDEISGNHDYEQMPDWIYLESRPSEFEPGAPDYTRQADGSIRPPSGWWYRLSVRPSDDLVVDWGQVASLRVRLRLGGGYFASNSAEIFWDDVCLDTTTVVPDPLLCTATSPAGVIMSCPGGDGPSLGDAGLTIEVFVRDAQGVPFVGLPANEVWLGPAVPSAMYSCESPLVADAATDANGRTTISGALSAGGFLDSGLQVYVQGSAVGSPPLEIEVRSADLTGDGMIDSCDENLFAHDSTSPYQRRSDFDHSLAVDLTDRALFAMHLTHGCAEATLPYIPMSGVIGLYVDEAMQSTVAATTVGRIVPVHAVLHSMPADVTAVEFGVRAGPGLTLLGATTTQSYVFGVVGEATNLFLGGGCLDTSSPIVLATYMVMLSPGVEESYLELTESTVPGTSDVHVPMWLACGADCDRRRLDISSRRATLLGNPRITAGNDRLFNDSFAYRGTSDATTPTARDELDIRLDMARDISTEPYLIDPGDSIVIEIVSQVPGVSLVGTGEMIWILDRNPYFEDTIRTLPPGTTNVAGGSREGWEQWTGAVTGQVVTDAFGATVENQFYFDLPDEDFLYPGDRLRYYIRADDSEGNFATMPANTGQFEDGIGYARTYQVFGLPSITDDGGGAPTHPEILFVNDFGRTPGEEEYLQAFAQLGYEEGVDFDTYTVQAAAIGVSNGIGASGAHGANADQLYGYRCVVYATGALENFLLSDGTDEGANDKGNDLGVLANWEQSAAPNRSVAMFGDNLVSGLSAASTAGANYVISSLGCQLVAADVGSEINFQSNPRVLPLEPWFSTSFVAFGACVPPGNCTSFHEFDSIRPGNPGAFVGHGFEDDRTPGTTIDDVAGSVVFDRIGGGGTRIVHITFPYDLASVWDPAHFLTKAPPGIVSARSKLLEEVLNYMGVGPGDPGSATGAPRIRGTIAALQIDPNPFNPAAQITYRSPAPAHHRVTIYDVRGRKILVLRDELRTGGRQDLVWDGRDQTGTGVASGVYLVEVKVDDHQEVRKVALVR